MPVTFVINHIPPLFKYFLALLSLLLSVITVIVFLYLYKCILYMYIPCDGIDSQNTNSSKVMLEYLAITPVTLGHLNPPMSLCPDVTEIDVIADPVKC